MRCLRWIVLVVYSFRWHRSSDLPYMVVPLVWTLPVYLSSRSGVARYMSCVKRESRGGGTRSSPPSPVIKLQTTRAWSWILVYISWSLAKGGRPGSKRTLTIFSLVFIKVHQEPMGSWVHVLSIKGGISIRIFFTRKLVSTYPIKKNWKN